MRSLACIVILVACSYSDPDLDTTRFRCDGGRPCPSGQVCSDSICVVATHDGVACMATTCSPSEQCCLDGVNPPHCISATAECLGRGATCDGTEDCASGTRCCADGVDVACAREAACGQFACLQSSDCPSTAPNCCTETTESTPWKICQLLPC